MRLRSTLAALAAAAGSVAFATVARAGITADQVVSYTPGDFTTAFNGSTALQNPASAVGPLAGDTGGGYGLNIFNAPYSGTQLVGVGPGGQITLHLSGPLTTAGGPRLGVFDNTTVNDVSGGSGVAGNPATAINPNLSQAVVQVSADGVNYVTLNGGSPYTFYNPTNYYLDGQITAYKEALGTRVANQFQPFLGTLTSFSGENLDQARVTLGGSAGGTWLDLSGSGLAVVNDVRFVVPAGVGYRLVLDGVSGVPEPTAAGLVVAAAAASLSRRRRRA